MACFKIEYFAPRGEHIELKPDGTIALFGISYNVEDSCVVLSEHQTRMLKAMIVAEAEMAKVAL